jgi:hypothetical protein
MTFDRSNWFQSLLLAPSTLPRRRTQDSTPPAFSDRSRPSHPNPNSSFQGW